MTVARRPGARRVAAMTAVAALALTVAVVAAIAATADPPVCRAPLIPAYLSPATAASRLAALPKTTPDALLVLNPASGPGRDRSAADARTVATAHRAGAKVLGYVPTTYGTRSLAAAEADVDRYVRWYEIDGIFFDEAAADARDLPYYRALSRHVRASGDRLVVVNPGIVPARGYLAVADVLVTFEGDVDAYAQALRDRPSWVRRERRERFAGLIYGATRADALRAIGANPPFGYVYVTDGALPNPWGALPSYLDDEHAALRDGC